MWVPLPPVVLSTASPGEKWSTVVVGGSMGTRLTLDTRPEGLITAYTMSFELQPVRKRQSCQATKIRPRLSISADGNGSVRMLPTTRWSEIVATGRVALQLTPPSDEVK